MREHGILAPGTSIPPDIPVGIQTLLLAELFDLRRRNALVVAIVPLADVLGDLDTGFAGQAVIARLTMRSPGKRVLVLQVEELQGALGTPSWRDVAVRGLVR